ncbi:MAG: TM2 domain-containing protein [Candidatus Nomurabacteria bacterium]|nr:TM2 domain-containing protein [Candidatus Nomurabacteria bacterium]
MEKKVENPNQQPGTNNANNNGFGASGQGPDPNGAPINNGNIPPQGYYGPPQQPQPQQPYYGAPAAPQGGKSSVAAGLLGIFLGWTGAHDFYLGYKQLAIVHLSLGGAGFLLTIISTILPFIFAGAGSYGGAVWSVMLLPVRRYWLATHDG